MMDWESVRRARIDKALTDFVRKKISADEYKSIREQTVEEFMEERGQADEPLEAVS